MESRLLNLSMFTSYRKKEKAYLFSRSKVKFQGHWTFIKIQALGSLWAGNSKNYAVSVLKLSMYTSYESGRSLFIFKFKGHSSRSLDLYKKFWYLDHCGQYILRTMQSPYSNL